MKSNKDKKAKELPTEEYFDRKYYEIKSTDSYIWYMYATEVYRGAELLASSAISANNKDRIRSIEEFNKITTAQSLSTSRNLTLEEEINLVDSTQIRTAYFLLARAIELMVKAVLLEIDPQSFVDKNDKYKLKFGHAGHDLLKMFELAGIDLDKTDKDNLKLLSHYPFIGTYPIPTDVKFDIKERKLKEELRKRISHDHYDEVARL